MTATYVGLDLDGLERLARVLDRQSDLADDIGVDLVTAAALSGLDAHGPLGLVRAVADRDRAAAAELRRRVRLAAEFRIELTVGTLGLLSASEHGRAVRRRLDELQTLIDRWSGSDNDPRLDELLVKRRDLLERLVGADRAATTRLTRMVDDGVAIDEAVLTVTAERIEAHLAMRRDDGLDEEAAVRELEAQLWISMRSIALVDDGLEAAEARKQASFEHDAASLVAQGHTIDVAESLVASMYLSGGLTVPDGVEPFDAADAVDRFRMQLDVARQRADGEAYEADGFVSFADLRAAADPANGHLFSADVSATARAALDLADRDGRFADQFWGDGIWDWMARHRDEIAAAAAIGAAIAVTAASAGTLSPLAMIVVGGVAGAGVSAGTAAGINAASDNYDLFDEVAANAGSGLLIGMASAGVLAAGRALLTARAGGMPWVRPALELTTEGSAVVGLGGVDLVVPEEHESQVRAVAAAVGAAGSLALAGAQVRSVRAAIADRAEQIVTVYRVQGGTPPKASVERIVVGEGGNIAIADRRRRLYVTFDDRGRASAYVERNRPGARIVAFDVDRSFLDELRVAAVPQSDGGIFRHAPQLVDTTKTGGSFGLPTEWIDRLVESARPGTARYLEP